MAAMADNAKSANTTKSSQAYNRLRSMLERGAFDDEQRLTESRLIELLNMRRGPVRDSLLRLEAEGYIRFHGHRRGRVIEFVEDQDKEDLLKRYEMREMIVAGAARLAAKNLTGYQIDHLRNLAKCVTDIAEYNDPKRVEAVSVFWDTLLSNCGNDLFYNAWRRYRLTPPCPRSQLLQDQIMAKVILAHENQGSMKEIVDAIASHDPDRAEHTARVGVQAITRALRDVDWEVAPND